MVVTVYTVLLLTPLVFNSAWAQDQSCPPEFPQECADVGWGIECCVSIVDCVFLPEDRCTIYCVLEQIYGEHSEKTELLRYFRDNVLSQTPEGQEIIKLYYEMSPVIVEMMEKDESFKQEVKHGIDGVLELIKEAE
jgi:hypothetical protein